MVTPRQARRATAYLQRPEEINPKLWGKVKLLLEAISDRYPTAFPGQGYLAQQLGVSVPTIQRYLCLAVKADLVEVTPDSGASRRPGHGHFKTNTYSLKYLNGASKLMSGRGIKIDARSSSSPNGEESLGKKASLSSLEGRELAFPAETPGGNSQAGREGNVVAFKKRDEGDPDGWGPSLGEDPEQPLRATVSKLDPAVWFSRYFEDQWKSEVLSQHPEWRGTVHWGQRGASVSYFRGQMIDHLSPDHVEAFIDGFIDAVLLGMVDFRPGQTAWQRFTAWWTTVEIEDPAIAEAARESTRKTIEAYRAAMAEEEKQGVPRGFLDRHARGL